VGIGFVSVENGFANGKDAFADGNNGSAQLGKYFQCLGIDSAKKNAEVVNTPLRLNMYIDHQL